MKCKLVVQNDRGMLGQVRDSVYRGRKIVDGIVIEKSFCFPRKLAERKWLEWLDAEPTEAELQNAEPVNREERRAAVRCHRANAKLKGEPMDKQNDEQNEKERNEMSEKSNGKQNVLDGKQSKCYAIMATASGGTRPAMVLTDEQDAEDIVATLESVGAVLTEPVSYEIVETILRH